VEQLHQAPDRVGASEHAGLLKTGLSFVAS
jgi:hypothetical protein